MFNENVFCRTIILYYIILGSTLEESPNKKTGETSSPSTPGKRPRDTSDNEIEKPEIKKLSLEESVPLEGDLSDISDDDADEILNREDSVSRKYYHIHYTF